MNGVNSQAAWTGKGNSCDTQPPPESLTAFLRPDGLTFALISVILKLCFCFRPRLAPAGADVFACFQAQQNRAALSPSGFDSI